MIKRHEGRNKENPNRAYPDPIYGSKIPTIGWGYNLKKSVAKQEIESLGLDYNSVVSGKIELSEEQIEFLFQRDLARAIEDAKQYLSNFSEQPSAVKNIIVDMSFNLGMTRLSNFVKLRDALIRKDYKSAAEEMKNSKWYKQVGDRGIELYTMMSGV